MRDLNFDGETSYPVDDTLMTRGKPFLFSTGYNQDRPSDRYLNIPKRRKSFYLPKLGDAPVRLLDSTERHRTWNLGPAPTRNQGIVRS